MSHAFRWLHVRDDDGSCAYDCPRCEADRVAEKEALKSRRLAFLADLNELSAKHQLHIDAWAEYADSAFFGISEGPATYTLCTFSYKENDDGEIEHNA